MDVSIVIVSWNVKDYLLRCIESIQKTVIESSYEIVVVDNASKDATVEVVLERFSWVKLISNSTNVGFSTANNQGFRVANGRYVLILNPDTILLPRTIDYLVSVLNQNENIGAITAKVIYPDGSVQRSCARKEWTLSNFACDAFGIAHLFPNIWLLSGTLFPYRAYDERREVSAMSGAFMLVRKDALEIVEGFDERFLFGVEDIDLAKRIRDAGWLLMYEPAVEVVHIGGQSQKRVRREAFKRAYNGYPWFFRKHYSRTVEIIILGVIWVRFLLLLLFGFVNDVLRLRLGFTSFRDSFKLLLWWSGIVIEQVSGRASKTDSS